LFWTVIITITTFYIWNTNGWSRWWWYFTSFRWYICCWWRKRVDGPSWVDGGTLVEGSFSLDFVGRVLLPELPHSEPDSHEPDGGVFVDGPSGTVLLPELPHSEPDSHEPDGGVFVDGPSGTVLLPELPHSEPDSHWPDGGDLVDGPSSGTDFGEIFLLPELPHSEPDSHELDDGDLVEGPSGIDLLPELPHSELEPHEIDLVDGPSGIDLLPELPHDSHEIDFDEIPSVEIDFGALETVLPLNPNPPPFSHGIGKPEIIDNKEIMKIINLYENIFIS